MVKRAAKENGDHLRKNAEAYRRLAIGIALEILEGPLRPELIDMANEYARSASYLEAKTRRRNLARRRPK